MSGGVSMWEYLVPPVAAAHLVYNRAQNTFGEHKDKIVATGSKDDRKDQAAQHEAELQMAAQQAEAERQALIPRPQTGQEEQASRRRAIAASEVLGGGRRRKASQTLTGNEQTLSGLQREVI